MPTTEPHPNIAILESMGQVFTSQYPAVKAQYDNILTNPETARVAMPGLITSTKAMFTSVKDISDTLEPF